ncbi:TPA: hypothetical protein ACM89E_005034, partial [Escherichia coli O103:H2]
MIPMKNYLFQTPEDICVQLKKMTHPVTIRTTDIANFWHYLESATLPVITKSTTTENREVTFLWRSEKALGFAPIFPDICYHLTHYKP